ncbi:MAG TPA: flagellar basal-body rod protein FlgF [Burkholderiaceae bacterium]|jgi:flagellar basal-body rod protein FlgF|nr:flagellar basal-body rod protein FlgF [Burkholderiaceae bacterium]
MDRMIYTAMTGAKATLQRQDALANNLANANTQGFRRDLEAFRAVPIQGDGLATRVHALEATAGFDATPGPVTQTGRALDVAVRGDGWIAVQAFDGSEAYTRSGSLELSPEGVLRTRSGLTVLGDGGPIVVPANAEVTIGADGTVSAKSAGAAPVSVGQIKLVNPPAGELRKGGDGLIRTVDGDPAPSDPAVRLASGAVEGSNVNVVESMIGLIAASRQFEMQMKIMQTAESNEQRAAQLLSSHG